jgi:TetR/AcrR family transcriptional regulator, transcriptional repressor for nem operon
MARPMEFDRDEAVKRATSAFWECGYNSISAAELVERMGIAKSSFYNAFSSKTDLLREAIARYTRDRAVGAPALNASVECSECAPAPAARRCKAER